MSLKVYKADKAQRDYENDFFREVASNLKQMFEDEGLDGILLGHPEAPEKTYLQPDCVLIMANRLVIIDFKNYEGKMRLPDETGFETVPWRRANDGTIIGGGNTINPYAQLKRHKQWIEEMIGKDTYGRAGIACVVCFQGDMNVLNEVPGRYQPWFSVTNKYQYMNRIRDIVGVEGPKQPVDINEIFKHFEAEPYHDFYPVSLKDAKAASEANERSAEADKREYEAEQKVKKLEKEIERAQSEKRAAVTLKEKLRLAKEAALEAKEAAEMAKSEFDEKKHVLEVETQKAVRARAEAEKAKSEEKKAEIDAERTGKIGKIAMIVAGVGLVIVIIAAVSSVWSKMEDYNREEQQKAEEKAQLEEDYKNGRACIPVERVAEFVDNKGVCVDFYANYINDSNKYVFIDNEKNGTFALMISKSLVSEQDAKSKYLNQHLEARGTITKYQDTYEIMVTDLSQISVKE